MGSLIKNQLLKHLSKFTKNLSPDKINISTLKGEGELSNLELDEVILMELLDLPTWMKLNKAVCNKVSIKIQWTKLKSQPICLFLDEVVLELETCTEPRPANSPNHQSSYRYVPRGHFCIKCNDNDPISSSYRSEGRYGFIDKVIDGMYIHINSVSMQFMSQKFHASLQLSRVKVQSLTPNWQQPTDLRQSRIRNEPEDQLLLFKEVDWQTTRIEAIAHEDENGIPSTPLRFIANQSKIRIVFKKKLSDCSIIASRVIFLLDDILWVLTDTQLKAAILYANSLRDMIDKSAQQSKQLAADKLRKQGHISSSGSADHLLQQQQQQRSGRSQTTEARLFAKYDVSTTSYHLITSRIDLHLCDDTPTDKESSPKHNRQIDGGAMQITFCKLSVDFYPFHMAGGERKNWYRYTDNQGSRNTWVQDLFKNFRAEASKARDTCKVKSPSQSPLHTPNQNTQNLRSPLRSQQQARSQGQGQSHGVKGQGQTSQQAKVTKLLESCMVLRIEEFIIYRVSTADNKRSCPQKFFSSDKKALHLPADMSMVHIEYTDYFFTEGIDYPVPHANLYVLVNPVRLSLDFLTILWANYFSLNLAQMVETQKSEFEEKLEHTDIKIEAVMPRIVLSGEEKVENQPDRPDSIQIQISKITASNTHIENKFTLKDLQDVLEQYKKCDMFKSHEFPNDKNNMASIPSIFQEFAHSRVNSYLTGYARGLLEGRLPEGFSEKDFDVDFETDAIQLLLRTNTLKRDARCDIWSVALDQVWVEFLGVPTSRTRPVPFVESIPLTLWISRPKLIPDGVISPSNSDDKISNETQNSSEASSDSEEGKERKSRRSKLLLNQFYSQDGEDANLTNQNGESGNHSKSINDDRSGDLKHCDNEKAGNVQYTSAQVADFNIVAKIGGKIRAQLNHSQYLFLMRLVESVSNFQANLNADYEDLLTGSNSPENASSFSIPLVIPELEFAMVCPYIAELLPLSNPADLLCSPLSESSGGREGYEDTYSDTQGDIEGTNMCNIHNNNNTEEVLTITQSQQGPHIEISESLYPENHLSHSQSDSTIVCHAVQQGTETKHVIPGIRRDSHSTDDVSQKTDTSNLGIMGQNIQYTSDSGLSSLGSSVQGQRSRTNSKLTPTSVKKTLTSGMGNISNFMGKIKNKLDPDDIDDDNVSIRTDISDEDIDFEFLSLDEGDLPAFHHSHMSETASSTDTDDLSSVFAESTSASKAKETVSAIVFRLSGTELLIQSCHDDMFLRLQTQTIDCEETGNVVYEDFYNKLSSAHGVMKHPAEPSSKYPIKFKYTIGPGAELEAPRGGELGVMEARVLDYDFKFNMSSITNMTNFIEDEKLSVPMPMHVSVRDLRLTLMEDRPPVNPTSTVPSEPVVLNIHDLFIRRHDDGVLHMTTGKPDSLPQAQKQLKSLPNSVNISQENTMIQENKIDGIIDFDTSDLPSEVQTKVKSLQNQNLQAKMLLEKFDNHIRKLEQDSENNSKLVTENDDLKSENKLLRDKLKTFALSSGTSLDGMTDLRKENSELESDNNKLMERVVALEDDLNNVCMEKASLVSTLQLLQDELLVSEGHRHRRTSHNES